MNTTAMEHTKIKDYLISQAVMLEDVESKRDTSLLLSIKLLKPAKLH